MCSSSSFFPGRYLDDTARTFRLQLKQAMTVRAPKGGKGGKGGAAAAPAGPPKQPTSATVWIAKAYPTWQVRLHDSFLIS